MLWSMQPASVQSTCTLHCTAVQQYNVTTVALHTKTACAQAASSWQRQHSKCLHYHTVCCIPGQAARCCRSKFSALPASGGLSRPLSVSVSQPHWAKRLRAGCSHPPTPPTAAPFHQSISTTPPTTVPLHQSNHSATPSIHK